MTRDDVQLWIDAYLEAWRTYDPMSIGDLFAADATYAFQPYRAPLRGRHAIVESWLESPDAPGSWSAEFRPHAVEDERAAAVGTVRYLENGRQRTIYFNVWLLRFDPEGRCADFVEYWREPPEELRSTI